MARNGAVSPSYFGRVVRGGAGARWRCGFRSYVSLVRFSCPGVSLIRISCHQSCGGDLAEIQGQYVFGVTSAVEWIATQPVELTGRCTARGRRHVPDIMLRTSSGRVRLMNMKPEHRLEAPAQSPSSLEQVKFVPVVAGTTKFRLVPRQPSSALQSFWDGHDGAH